MTLHEAASVILIIGTVVLGPYEGKDISWYNNGCGPGPNCAISSGTAAACKGAADPRAYADCTVREMATYETVAELCTRLLREMGTRYVRRYISFHHIDKGWRVDGQPVVCLPAPSGSVQ